jgi:hypothetical protein
MYKQYETSGLLEVARIWKPDPVTSHTHAKPCTSRQLLLEPTLRYVTKSRSLHRSVNKTLCVVTDSPVRRATCTYVCKTGIIQVLTRT